MNDFPALNGDVVTERHARTCREQGHATHTVDGVRQACPRCGEVTVEVFGKPNAKAAADQMGAETTRFSTVLHLSPPQREAVITALTFYLEQTPDNATDSDALDVLDTLEKG